MELRDWINNRMKFTKKQYDQVRRAEIQKQILSIKDRGSLSDGYHTFDELYYHRMMLFSIICNTYKEYAWKSWKHSEGDKPMYNGMFIVGVSLPNGDYSYHYDMQYWDKFDVKVLDRAPVWDGHEPKDITRLEYLLTINT